MRIKILPKLLFTMVLALVLTLSFSNSVFSDEANLRVDPEIKDRFKHLAQELRCLKCQNQTIWDSKAGLANDLREQISDQIYAGKNDVEIVDYMVERYGEFIRFKPAVNQANIFLWVGPFGFMIVGGLLLVRYVKSRKAQTEEDNENISDEDRLRAEAILKQGGDK